jgi:hypothetical protein
MRVKNSQKIGSESSTSSDDTVEMTPRQGQKHDLSAGEALSRERYGTESSRTEVNKAHSKTTLSKS